ncbi:MAG: hypothetical protein KA250_00645 [Verrucomicrobiales bacterium]|nr:hypothetical protein [Verrucomicrobiales bacterium]MBP9224483.1 hypothetical protein [Verrucomicrobiales bacterium]
MNLLRLFVFTFLTLPFLSSSVVAEDRSWTNRGGKQIVGELIEIREGTAVLSVGGKNFEVPIASLSPADQEFIGSWKKSEMTDSSKDGAIKPNWDGPWPKIVSADVSQEIEIVKENSAENEYIYASKHYEFICDVKLNTSVVKRFSLLFEATNQVCRELPLGMVKPFREERHKIHLFETREGYAEKGGPEGSAGVYISSGGEGDVLVPLTSLGVKKVGSNYSVDYDRENTTLSHEITHQLTDMQYYEEGSRGWFTEGLAEYIANSGYRSGKFDINDLQKLIARVTAYGDNGQGGRALGESIRAPDLQAFFVQSYESFLSDPQKSYGLAGLYVYYFFHMDGNKDAANVKGFLKALKEDKKPPELFEPLLAGRTWDQMEADITQGWRSRGVKIDFQ